MPKIRTDSNVSERNYSVLKLMIEANNLQSRLSQEDWLERLFRRYFSEVPDSEMTFLQFIRLSIISEWSRKHLQPSHAGERLETKSRLEFWEISSDEYFSQKAGLELTWIHMYAAVSSKFSNFSVHCADEITFRSLLRPSIHRLKALIVPAALLWSKFDGFTCFVTINWVHALMPSC